MTEVLIGTKKGLFALHGDPGAPFEIAARAFAGEAVEFAMRDPRSGRYFAATTNAFYGPKLWLTDDPAGEWQEAQGVELPEGGEDSLKRIWTIVPGEEDNLLYAGGDPGVLFESRDGGLNWELNVPFWEQPTRPEWGPGAGGLCLHTISTWPGDPSRLALGISAVGVWLSDDGGKTWRHGNKGLVPRYLPEESREGSIALCVHNMHRAPQRPERLFMQFHGGVYRSDDSGESWNDIGAGLPSDFGFPLVVDPDDPDNAYVIPLTADMDRVTPEGRVRVFETRDAGSTWTSRGDGLPAENAYLTILRQAFGATGAGEAMQLYFGATSGEVFGSSDAGATWSTAATHLPPVYSVRVS
jgi:BNR/Asp-box repeat protein